MSIEIRLRDRQTTGDVDLNDLVQINLFDEAPPIEPVIARVDVDIVDIEQQATPTARRELVEKVSLAHLLLRNFEVVDVVLEQEGRGHFAQDIADSFTDHLENGLVVGDR